MNAVGFFGTSQMAGWLASRFGMMRVVTLATLGYAAFTVLLFAATLAGFDSLAVLIVLLFCAFAFLGLVIPTTMVLALEEHGPIAGMASALGGTLQMVAGAVAIVIVSFFFDGTTMPMATAIGLCGIGTYLLARLTLRGGDVTADAPA